MSWVKFLVSIEEKSSSCNQWQDQFRKWQQSEPSKAQALTAQLERKIPAQLELDLVAALGAGKKAATREHCGEAIQIIAKHVPFLVGGSADLEPSNKTLIKGSTDIQGDNFAGRNIRFGVREHGMGGLVNGLAYTRQWIPYTGTFLVFSDYMRPAIRLAALAKLQSLFLFSHDSFWVGEDGPTHQPIEQTASLRLIPRLRVYRPADGLEVAACFVDALDYRDGPSTLIFTRQSVPPLVRSAGPELSIIRRGGYVVSGNENGGVVICATGSEVALAFDAASILVKGGINVRVVSLPCIERFLEQPEKYRQQVIPPNAKKIAIEAGTMRGWERVVGSDSLLLGLETFGASAPGEVLAEKFGFTPTAIAARIKAWL